MSDYRARIALARDAYRAAQPSPDEIRAGAARIESQLANPANHMRRLLQFLGGGALLGAGVLAVLNHAADDSGRPQEGLRASAADSAIVAANSSAGLGQPQGWMQPMQVTPDVGRTAEDPPSPGDSQDEAGGRPSSRGASTAKRSATTTKAVQSPGESKAAPPPPTGVRCRRRWPPGTRPAPSECSRAWPPVATQTLERRLCWDRRSWRFPAVTVQPPSA